MSLKPKTMQDLVLSSLLETAIELIVAVKNGDLTNVKLKSKKIGTMGDALK
jgi:hypothetical protein